MAPAAFVAIAVVLCAARAAVADISFPGVPFPFSSTDKHSTLTVRSAVVGKGTVLSPNAASSANGIKGGFQLLTRTWFNNTPGALYDVNGAPLMAYGSNFTVGTVQDTSFAPDATTLLPRIGNPAKADLFVHFEAPNPGSIYHFELDVAADGALSIAYYQPVNFSNWGGLWTPCAGSMSPWNSHLGSEEYEPDARTFFNLATTSVPSRIQDFARYYGLYRGNYASTALFWAALRATFNPYKYGFVTEVYYSAPTNRTIARKWYTLGRVAVEMALVMPDQKTVYITDDGRNVGFFKFVATAKANLNTGRLYAAKFTQTSAASGGNFTLGWVDLGFVNQTAIAAAVNANTTFAMIFNYTAPVAGACPEGFRGVTHSYGAECLALMPGKEMLAAALETRRYAAYLGATTEWTKWEGITLDTRRRKLYTAMTQLDSGTLTEASRLGSDDVRLPANKCGCVYGLDLDANYSAVNMYPVACGTPDVGVTPGLSTNNTCHIDQISNPDNVYYDNRMDTLFIAEDTDYHENAFLWAFNPKTSELTRLISTPVGAEVTGTAVFRLNGFTYIWNNFQHPFDGADFNAAAALPAATGRGGYIGYFGPFKMDPFTTLALQHIPAPTDTDDKLGTMTSPKVVIGREAVLGYNVLGRSGQSQSGHVLGRQVGNGGTVIKKYVFETNYSVSTQDSVSFAPDFSSLTTICNTTFATTQFEWQNPASMYVQTMSQSLDGVFTSTASAPVDWSAWGGLWTPCAGSITPWGSRMGSEEYEPDARLFENATTLEQIGGAAMAKDFTYTGGNAISQARQYGLYYGTMNVTQFKAAVKPYMYGFVTEVKVQYDGSYVNRKHYTLGRVASEMGYVMPDRRTVYVTDDGSNVGFYRFVADMPNDLSAGNLYAARASQEASANGGKFRISWIWLGYGTQDTLLAAAATLKFSDLFETATPTNGTCPTGFKGTNAGDPGCECLKLKTGMGGLAAFFETRRYAAYLGATTEWSKWEGITYDAKRNTLHTAVSDVRNGMEDNKSRGIASTKYDICGPNDLRVDYVRCGCVYSLPLDGQYSAYYMEALLCGTTMTNASAPGYVASNNCHMDRIASPDNVAYIPEHDVLIVGEDTSDHQNDVIWAYDMQTKGLTRIFTTPYGSETTGPYWYPDVNGFGYLTAVVQHPYGESDATKLGEAGSFGEAGAWGVIGPFPSVRTGLYAQRVAERCDNETAQVVEFEVTFQRTVFADAARYDSHVLSRLDTLLYRTSKRDFARRVAIKLLPPTPGTGGQEQVTIVGKVQFPETAIAGASNYKAALSNPAGDFQTQVRAMLSTLTNAAAGITYTSPSFTALDAVLLTKAEAYAPSS